MRKYTLPTYAKISNNEKIRASIKVTVEITAIVATEATTYTAALHAHTLNLDTLSLTKVIK